MNSGFRGGPQSERLSRAQATEAQRARIISSITRVASQHGTESISVASVIRHAGVSRRTFYEQFTDRGDCLLAAMEHVVALAGERARAEYASRTRWLDRVRAGLYTVLRFFDEEPELARLCIVHAMAAGTPALVRRAEILEQLAGVLDEGRHCVRGNHQPSPLSAQGIGGGVFEVIYARLSVPDGCGQGSGSTGNRGEN